MTTESTSKAAIYEAYQGVFGAIDAILFRCKNDADYTMEFMEGGVLALTGYLRADILDNASISWFDLMSPEDTTRVEEEIEAAIASDTAWDVDYRIKHKSGDWRWVRERGCVVKCDGEIKFMQGMIVSADAEQAARSKSQVRAAESERDKAEILAIAKDILRSVNKLSMLSINARIEASRSGDAGRGFAVVASEIGSLADENRSAAKKIAGRFT